MRVGLLQEGEVRDGKSYAQRYREMIDEVVLADALGFSTWGTSEQHFSPPRFTVSAPEVLYAAVAARTQPDQAPRHGLGAARSGTTRSWSPSGSRRSTSSPTGGPRSARRGRTTSTRSRRSASIPPTPSAQWADGMDVLAKALTQELARARRAGLDDPAAELVPRCMTEPHPPVSLAASSVASHVKAGERGIGAICFENYFGFEYLQACIDAYRDGSRARSPHPLRPERLHGPVRRDGLLRRDARGGAADRPRRGRRVLPVHPRPLHPARPNARLPVPGGDHRCPVTGPATSTSSAPRRRR